MSDTELSSGTELGSSPSSETTRSYPVWVSGFLPWKRRRLSCGAAWRKGEALIKKTKGEDHDDDVVEIVGDWITDDSEQEQTDAEEPYPQLDQHDHSITGSWEVKEVVSRDGQAKLKANVFFASFDQRSEKASGESACTAVVVIVAHWLHSNRDTMPTRHEFDSLITEGSAEWRKLCSNEAHVNFFPDKHFDLETVLEANLRPLTVLPEKSFVGFFSPEKFEFLKGAMSFDEIWKKINSNGDDDYAPTIFIVSWNDHFFVLKVEDNAYYIIDSLGERLFEGCSQAYILKFDDSTLMYGNAEKEEIICSDPKKEGGEIICSGKDCCREFIKRFFVAIQLGELEDQEKKGIVSNFSLYQRLQVEFHYSSCSSTSPSLSHPSSSATSSTLSHNN